MPDEKKEAVEPDWLTPSPYEPELVISTPPPEPDPDLRFFAVEKSDIEALLNAEPRVFFTVASSKTGHLLGCSLNLFEHPEFPDRDLPAKPGRIQVSIRRPEGKSLLKPFELRTLGSNNPDEESQLFSSTHLSDYTVDEYLQWKIRVVIKPSIH